MVLLIYMCIDINFFFFVFFQKICYCLFCDVGFRYENFDCILVYIQILKKKYEMNICFMIKLGRIELIIDFLFKIIRYIYLNDSFDNLICKVCLFVELDVVEIFKIDYLFMFYVEMFYYYFYNYKESFNYLLEYFKFDDVIRNILNVEFFSQFFKF